METLVKILPADLVGKLHTGQSDSPELGTVGMQQLLDAHPNLIDEKFNSAVDIQNKNNTEFEAAIAEIPKKADATNVLTKDNTVPYTPTEDNHPATRKYVLDSINTSGNVTPEQTDYWNGKSDKSTAETAILASAGWSDNQQTLSVDGATATNIIEIAVDKAATLEQEAAFYAAALKDGGQDDGTITLNVSGKIPSVDIPILVIARGDL